MSSGARSRSLVTPAGACCRRTTCAEHVELAYATTAYGAQGSTVPVSHVLVGEHTGAASAYVGMTRGRERNVAHLVAESVEDARRQWVEVFGRDRADLGPAHAARLPPRRRPLRAEGRRVASCGRRHQPDAARTTSAAAHRHQRPAGHRLLTPSGQPSVSPCRSVDTGVRSSGPLPGEIDGRLPGGPDRGGNWSSSHRSTSRAPSTQSMSSSGWPLRSSSSYSRFRVAAAPAQVEPSARRAETARVVEI